MNEKHAMVITPVSLLEEFSTHHHLVLTQYYRGCKAYREFYQKRRWDGDFIIQDNGAAELKASIQISDLIAVAEDLHPNVIVAPDTIYDAEKTLKSTGEFVEQYWFQLQSLGVEIMAVPQGSTMGEWFSCYEVFNTAPHISWLGISMFYTPTFNHRADVLKRIASTVSKPCHLLGLWDNPLDLLEERQYDFVRSVDTAKAVEFGFEGLQLRDWAKHEHIDDDWYFMYGKDMRGNFNGCLTDGQRQLISANVSDYVMLFENGMPPREVK